MSAKHFRFLFFCLALLALISSVYGQQASHEPTPQEQRRAEEAQRRAQQAQQILMSFKRDTARRVGNPALRYEVDAKRTGTNMNSEDALPRSREFIRIDSSYYIGWMYEGAYKFNHAADYLGYKNAIAPLDRARRQM